MVRNPPIHHTTVGHTLLFTFDRNMYAGHKVWEACFAVTNDLQDGDIVIVCSDPAGYPSAPTAIKKGGSGERTYNHFFEDLLPTEEVVIVLRPLGRDRYKFVGHLWTFQWNAGLWVMQSRAPSRFHQHIYTII